ncbi:MAG: prepilin-type N-terminal cleavage/methylation domain-containing protein [Puniceicoccales bacterium]|jgi:prepilin-type N-terminal cleavage/methylation domain-containing protein|nr:prepilin-type N-terminal cleavage/methylation domain-containing protein [Puniceicoccales bacterium]
MLRRKTAFVFRPAFTLIEILTATAIMVVLIMIVLTVATQTFNAYDSAIANLSTTSESRAVLGPLEQDLQSAIIRNDGHIWMQIEHPNDVGNIIKGAAPKLMLFSIVPDRQKRESGTKTKIGGDVCAVCYQLGQRSPFDNPGELIQQIYGFYRAIVDAKGTFDVAIPLVTGSLTGAGQDPLNYWNGTGEVLDINGSRTSQSMNTWATGPQNFQASNVVNITMVFWYYNPNTKKMEALVHQSLSQKVRDAYNQSQVDVVVNSYNNGLKIKSGEIIIDNNDAVPLKGTLRRIDVSTIILSPDGAAELRAIQAAEGNSKISQTGFDKIAEEYGKAFSISVPINL